MLTNAGRVLFVVLFGMLAGCGTGAGSLTPTAPTATIGQSGTTYSDGANMQWRYRRPSPVPTATATPAPVASTVPSVAAKSANAFVSSIGVVTHYNWAGDVYDNATAVALLKNSGIRYYRVGAAAGPGNPYGNFQAPWTTFNYLASNGIYGDYVWDLANFGGDPSTWNPTPNAFASGVSGIASYEGSNEPNYSCTGNNSWVSQQRTFMQTFWTYDQGYSSTIGIPMIAPSLANCTGLANLQSDVTALGALSYANVGNMHSYPGWTTIPEQGALVNSQGGTPSYTSIARVTTPSAPLQTTETGYGADKLGSTATQAEYDLRLLLNGWNQGVQRTYLFALIDDATDGTDFAHFGLVDGSYNPRPAYYAVQNLISTLADPGSSYGGGQLAYALTDNTANVQQTLLQKRDGTFYLVLWVAAVAGVGSQSVTLVFPVSHTVSAQTFASTGKLTSTSVTPNGKNYTLSVNDMPTIVSIQG